MAVVIDQDSSFPLTLFEFIRQKKDQKCSLIDLKNSFNSHNIEDTLDSHRSLFWVRKFSRNKWDIRVKLDLELCYLYSNNKPCEEECSKLHLCKQFLLGNQFCNRRCKYKLSHNIKDKHNRVIIEQYNMPVNIPLVKSSFPRLCLSFLKNGKCHMLSCGSLHLCPEFIVNNCPLKCEFSSKIRTKKQETHDLTSTHNQNIFQSFQLLPNEKAILLANILHNITEPLNSNEDFTTNDSSSVVSSDQPIVNTDPLILCSFYLFGDCKHTMCKQLHICKNYLVNSNSCPREDCSSGFSHNLLDEHNKEIILPKFPRNTHDEILRKVRRLFPQVCNNYNAGNCTSTVCTRLHVCKEFVRNTCTVENCELSHNLKDQEKATVFKSFNLECLLAQKGARNLKANILISNNVVCNVNKHSDDIQISENISEAVLAVDITCIKDKYGNQNFPPLLCMFYLNGKCTKQNGCTRLHFCKKFLINGNNCSTDICKYGFSHDFFDENNTKIISKHFTGGENPRKVLEVLRKSYPRICRSYENNSVCERGELCTNLHVCRNYLYNQCKNNDICMFSHDLRDRHNMQIFVIYNLQSLIEEKMEKYLMPNILVSKKSVAINQTSITMNGQHKDQGSQNFTSKHVEQQIFSEVQPLQCEVLNFHTEENTEENSLPNVPINNEPKKEDIIMHILNTNPHEGSCLLDDKQLLSFFDDQNADLAQNWFMKNSSSFQMVLNPSNKVTVHICLVNVEPCQLYWGTVGCSNKQCGRFHICKKMLFQNHNANSCNSNHDFEKQEVSELIKRNKLQRFTDEQVLTLLRNRYPIVCTTYQSGTCKETEDYCSKLHICKEFVANKCKKSEELCGLRHETSLDGKQAIRLAKSFHIQQDKLRSYLMFEKTSPESVAMNTGAIKFNSSKDEGICLSYVNGHCENKELCPLHHVSTPYLWQYKMWRGDAWQNVSDMLNEKIEKQFCIPMAKCLTVKISGIDSTIDFDRIEYEGVPFYGIYVDCIHIFRRLSTKSSVLVNNKDKSGSTEWKWFWKNSKWEEYSEGTTSGEIDKSYVSGLKDHTFTTDEFTYNLTFDTMVQQNQDERYLTERCVKRRPIFKKKLDLARKKSLCLYPSTWPKSFTAGDLVDVSAPKLLKLSTKFTQRMKKTVTVVKIQEVCNEEFYEKYQSKKKAMGKSSPPCEKFLYHGTAYDTVKSICVQNFDFRLSGKNATAFGKGSYFSVSAAYSHNFCSPDSNGYYYMFIAQVLTGCFTQGNSSYNRPPPIQVDSLELYDSCVDNVSKPTMYIIFERDQSYPRYMITYKLSNLSTGHTQSTPGVTVNRNTLPNPQTSSNVASSIQQARNFSASQSLLARNSALHQPSPHQQIPHQPSPHQPSPHQPSPHQPSPHQQFPHQPSPHQPSPHQPSPHQPSPHQQIPHQPIPHKPSSHQPSSHQPSPHQPISHQPSPHQLSPHQPSPHQPISHQQILHQPSPHQPSPHLPSPHQPSPQQPSPHLPSPHQHQKTSAKPTSTSSDLQQSLHQQNSNQQNHGPTTGVGLNYASSRQSNVSRGSPTFQRKKKDCIIS